MSFEAQISPKVKMRAVDLFLCLASLFYHQTASVKVFNFEGTLGEDPDAQLTNATMVLPEDLPSRFILCASFKWGKTDSGSTIKILDRNGDSWLMLLLYAPYDPYALLGPTMVQYDFQNVKFRPITW